MRLHRWLSALVLAFLSACCHCPPPPSATEQSGFPADPKDPTAYGLEKQTLRCGNREWTVFTIGPEEARPVLLLHELPGLTPGCARLASDLAKSFPPCRVYVPLLFGTFGDSKSLFPILQTSPGPRWNPCSRSNPGTILPELIDLTVTLSQRHCRGRPLTVIGNCLTGTLALGTLTSSSTCCAVVSQPASPFTLFSGHRKRSLWLSPENLELLRSPTGPAQNKPVLYFRYQVDGFSPAERMFSAAELLGGRFHGRVLAENSPQDLPPNTQWICIDEEASRRQFGSTRKSPLHSVITRHWDIQPTHAHTQVWETLHNFIHHSPHP